MAEDKFEQAVIDKLKSEGWEYLADYSGVTVDRLYEHWRDILNANNRKRLEDTPSSDNEFEQVKLELTKNSDSYNRDFAFGWCDDAGKDVTNTMTFIHEVMGIPALNRLVTVNMIYDAANDNLMVMRSCQILDRMREMDQNGLIEKEGGYIWHTTGSGKTVTSFKVAQLLASQPRVEDVLFIVDRVDLVNQTYENFKNVFRIFSRVFAGRLS